MDQKLIEKVTAQIISYIATSVGDSISAIVKENVTDESECDATVEAINAKLKSLALSIPKTAPRTTARAPSTKSATLPAILDSSGVVIKCSAITKSGNPCKNGARHHVNDTYLCGMHVRAGTGANPDVNKRPAVKAGSSFESVTSGVGTDIDFGEIDDINFEDDSS